MIIVLNGALGVGKPSLAEALSENIQQCVMLDGDHVVAANPSPEGMEHLPSTIELHVRSILPARDRAQVLRMAAVAQEGSVRRWCRL